MPAFATWMQKLAKAALRIFVWVVGLGTLGGLGYGTFYYWPRKLPAPRIGISQSVSITPEGTRVFVPHLALAGELTKFDDALFAFLMFDYIRSRPLLRGMDLMLTSAEKQERPVYQILVKLPTDLVAAIDLLERLKAERLTAAVCFHWITWAAMASYREETSVFTEAYNSPAARHLKAVHASELQGYLRRFIRFKSETDPRIANQAGPVPSPLTQKAASSLAADIIAVARFYDVPIDLFLGIGAMENNYMDVTGDLENTAWKRRADPGDIIIRRKRDRVLVKNDSQGIWQITRETLRYAHKLYLKDHRDYSHLPERLRPPKNLRIDSVESNVLTTYAGLLLRDLLDHFHGDAAKAAGAYNGGVRNPNSRYATGVQMVADYARQVIGRSAELDRVESEPSSVSPNKITKALSGARAASRKGGGSRGKAKPASPSNRKRRTTPYTSARLRGRPAR